MHIFLTGAVGVGKSTVIDRCVALLGVIPGGFRTYFGEDRYSVCHSLYMCEAGQKRRYDEGSAVAFFQSGQPPKLDRPRFESFGLHCLQNTAVPLLLMDECGRLEQEATLFQRRVLELLDGDTPILGVVRQDAAGWLDSIRQHPQVTVLTVTPQNRDALPREIAVRLRPYIKKGSM